MSIRAERIDQALANFDFRRKARKERADDKTNRAVEEQASANTDSNWIFDLAVKLKKSVQCISEGLPYQLISERKKLGERINALEKLSNSYKVENKNNEKYWEGLQFEFYPIMNFCNHLNKEFQKLFDAHDDCVLRDLHLDAVDMAKAFFHALDTWDDIFSRLLCPETPIINRTSSSFKRVVESGFTNLKIGEGCKEKKGKCAVKKEQASSKTTEADWIFELVVVLKKLAENIRVELPGFRLDELERLTEFISVLEKSPEIVLCRENETSMESCEFYSIIRLCDGLNRRFQHLHDAETTEYESDQLIRRGGCSLDFVMFDRKMNLCNMTTDLYRNLDKRLQANISRSKFNV